VFHNVPLYTQALSWACWYTAFEMVVGYERSRNRGDGLRHPSENSRAQAIYDANSGIGKDSTEREVVARALGFDCIYASMSADGMTDLLSYAPVIYAGHWPGKTFGHWVVLVGMSGMDLTINNPDPDTGRHTMDYDRFAGEYLLQSAERPLIVPP
jgi:ABC-type bacteriocin/lantibiotic exporter with double-glycine peptidase domain